MRLSTSTNIHVFDQGRPRAVSMEDSVRVCAEAGYQFIDANLCASCRENMPLTRDDWEQWAHQLRRVGDEAGIRFTQAHAYYGIGAKVTPDGVRSDGDQSEILMERSIRTAEILGVSWMVVHPLTVRDGEMYLSRASMEYNRAYYGRWAEEFARHHVGMAIENMSSSAGRRSFSSDPAELKELIERIDHPMVGACLDTGHAYMSGIVPDGAARMLGGHLHALHIADNHKNADEHLIPFQGTIDWPAFMRALRDIGYQDDFSFEAHMFTGCFPASTQKTLVKFSFELGNYLMKLAE